MHRTVSAANMGIRRRLGCLHGSACGPVTVPVFKTGGWQVFLSPVGSTPTRFRHLEPASLLKICTLVPLNMLDSVQLRTPVNAATATIVEAGSGSTFSISAISSSE
jgi:hypothetical protein